MLALVPVLSGGVRMSSPTARSLEMLRKRGYTACVVERYVSQCRQKFDAFGFGDILACFPGERILLVQTTTSSNLAARYTKTINLGAAEVWLKAGGAIELHGWGLKGPR